MDVHWLEQTESDVPADNGWLSAAETLRIDAMRFPKRRSDWRLGRWTAKHALAACMNVPGNPQGLRAIELRAAPGGAPEAYFAGQPAPLSLSLSHRNGTAACAVAPSGAALGCDLELIEPHSDGFLADYFTSEEQALVASAAERLQMLALLWSAKESALKAMRTGLRLDTRCVIATPSDAPYCSVEGWRPLQVRCTDGRVFRGWWQETDGLLRTLVAAPAPEAPARLRIAS